jgi:hypothetical protein
MDFLGMANQYYKNGRPGGSDSQSRELGFTATLNYVYDQRYYADFSGKYDGSSQFGANNHFAPFWSTGVGWNIQNEKWFKKNNILNTARLKASYGVTGSQNFPSYLSLRTYKDYRGKSIQGWYGAYLMSYGNEDLKWQTTKQLNIGTELNLFNHNLNISFDVYHKVTDDLVTDINLPLASGFESYKANVGSVENNGWELYVSGTILRSKNNDFRWKVGVNAVHNSNKIKSISNSLKQLNENLSKNTTYDPSFLYKEGESMNTIYAVKSKGIDPSTGKEIFIKADGVTETFTWSSEDLVPCGIDNPKIQGTINTSIYWKGLSANMYFLYRWGGYAYNATLANKVENIMSTGNPDRRVLYDRWTKPGDIAKFKSIKDFSATYATSRFVFHNNAFIGSSLNISYIIPKAFLRKFLPIDFLSISANTEDLFYCSTIKRERGTDYPFSRKFSFTFTARF